MSQQEYGIGLEAEGFIIDSQSKSVLHQIKNQPASEFVHKIISEYNKNILHLISFEQSSSMLELKTDVHKNGINALDQILFIQEEINKLLYSQHGVELSFQPTVKEDFDFICATTDTNSRTYELVDRWSQEKGGLQNLKNTVIAGFQINNSYPFSSMGNANFRDKIQKSIQIYKYMDYYFDYMNSMNDPTQIDYKGRTRMDTLYELLTTVKESSFKGTIFDKNSIVKPKIRDIDDFILWSKLQTGNYMNKDFEEITGKDEHSIVLKIKRDSPTWCLESRTYDSGGYEHMKKCLEQFCNLLAKGEDDNWSF